MREILAGCTGTLAVLPVVLTLGVLAFAPLGAAVPKVALLAAFVTAAIGGLIHTAFSPTRLPSSGPSSVTSLTFAGLVVELLTDPRLLPSAPGGVQATVALCGFTVLLSGALQVLFAQLGLARLVRVVPQPVLAGFMNSAAILVVLGQIPRLLGLPLGTAATQAHFGAAHPGALALGLGSALLIVLVARRWPRLPATLIGLVVGTAFYALWSTAFGAALSLGPAIGALPAAWPWPPALLPLLRPDGIDLLRAHGATLAWTALAIASIGSLETSLNARATDQRLASRHEPRHELIVVGCCNMVCGMLGGLPLVNSRTRAQAILRSGGRTRIAAWLGPVTLCLLYAAGSPLLAALPLAVLAGVMLVVAMSLADGWTGRMLERWRGGDRSRDLSFSMGVVALVVGTSLWWGMAAGIGFGVLLSLAAFATRMNRSLVHGRYTAADRPSRRVYPAAVEARLRPLRAGIVVFELDGALFFGTSDRLIEEADSLGDDYCCLVLDMRRVGAIDESGEVALQQIEARLEARGIRLMLAGLVRTSATAQALRAFGTRMPYWPDADHAVEAAEQRLLGEAGEAGDVCDMGEVALSEASLLAGLDAEQVAFVAARLEPRKLERGEVLFDEGDPADRLFIVGRGSITVLSQADRHGYTQRYLSVSPGMTLGEMAMLDGGGRSAGATADAPTTVYALTLGALDEIGRTQPDVAIRMYRNLALHLSQRLRGAAGAWRSDLR